MTRRAKLITTILTGLASLVVILGIAAVWISHTARFRDYVLQRIVTSVQESTGGRVEVGEVLFDWSHLRVELRQFVLHGTESADRQPLFQASSIGVELRLLSLAHRRTLDIASLDVREPRGNLVIDDAGRTNIPQPRVPRSENRPPLETLVDLAIGRFTVQGGSVQVADQQIPFSLQGENVAIHFSYELAPGQYRGQISMSPVIGQYVRNKPANAKLNLEMILGKDRIELTDATIATPNSNVRVSGAAEHLSSPQVSAKGAGHIDLAELKEILGPSLRISLPSGSPHFIDAQFDASMDDRQIRINSGRLSLGGSFVEASGTLGNTRLENGSIQFRADLLLAELARILDPSVEALGQLELGGRVRLNGTSDYHVEASMAGANLAFHRGSVNLSNIRLSSKIDADPTRIELSPFTVQMGPGQISGSAVLKQFARYQIKGNLNRLDLNQLLAAISPQRIDYGAALSGPIELSGDLKHSSSIAAAARLNIAPVRGQGVPVTGTINVDYDEPRDTVNVRNSYIAFPSSRLDFAGALGSEVDVRLTSRNLEDLRPVLRLLSSPPGKLPAQIETGGSVQVDARIAGRLSAPRIAGHLAVTRFQVEQRHFDQLVGDFTAANDRFAVDNASLRRDSLVAMFQGSVGLDRWAIRPRLPLAANATIQNGNVLDVLAFTGEGNRPISGDLSMEAHVSGTVGDPQGNARVHVMNGMAYGEPIDLMDAELSYGGQKISLPSLRIESGPARINLNATYEHPPEKLLDGTIRAHLDTNQVALARLQALQMKPLDLNGTIQLNLNAGLAVESVNDKHELRVVTVDGTVDAQNLVRQGRNLGNVAARVQTAGNKLGFQLTSNFGGSRIEARGETDLAHQDYETSANVNIQDLPVQDVLAAAGRSDLGVAGLLSAKGSVSGTLGDPRANVDVALTKAVVRRQPIDRLEGHLSYSDVLMELENGLIQAGPSRISLTGSFQHPPHDLSSGDLTVHAQGSQLQLAQIVYVQEWKPGISGALQVALDSSAKLHPPGSASRLTFGSLNARASLSGFRGGNKDLGAFTANVEGKGSTVTGDIESNLAGSTIKAAVKADLTDGYPASGQLTFSNVRYSNWTPLIAGASARPNFDALLEGIATLSGSLTKLTGLTGNAELTKAELYSTVPSDKSSKDIALRNDGPVTLVLDRSAVQIKRARWTGPSSQISVSGSANLQPVALNLDLSADADLGLIHKIRDDISSAGRVQMNASVRGPVKEPVVNGRIQLTDAAFQTSDMPNGISKANAVIAFGGTTATIQSLTAESGGGKLTGSGTISRFGGQNVYNVALRANRVQIRTASGASVGVNADVKLNGTESASVLSGTVTIRNVGFNPQSDLGTILAETANPPSTPEASTGFMATTRLDLTIKTAPGASFQSVYATSLDASADLTMRGTLANPGMLGRVSISSGELIFFGTKYTLDSGSVFFYNSTKIDPILDLNLGTTARGVQVTLNVTGPVTNMNLAYQSDPPLQFSEIVGLLAAGRMPTSDPVLLAHQPAVPDQSFQQMGESAVLNKVVTNPVAGQLKRVFGVTELKIDPTFTSGSELPQARLTLQQNVTKKLTFTYVTDVTSADSQILRAEWALNQRWSAVATRQENGLVGIDLFYKRRFR